MDLERTFERSIRINQKKAYLDFFKRKESQLLSVMCKVRQGWYAGSRAPVVLTGIGEEGGIQTN